MPDSASQHFMATAKKTSAKKSSTKKASTRKAASKRAPAKKSAAKKSATKKASTKRNATTARSNNPSSTGHGKAKKAPAKQGDHCWPGYKPVAGKKPGTKGSCAPKANKTAAQKEADGIAAAASKLRKAGGSKARANRSH